MLTLFTLNHQQIKGYSPKKSSIRRSCDTGSSINWSPLTTSNCSRGKTSNHLCTWTWYCDIASGRYASLTVPFGRIAKSSNDLGLHWRGRKKEDKKTRCKAWKRKFSFLSFSFWLDYDFLSWKLKLNNVQIVPPGTIVMFCLKYWGSNAPTLLSSI